MSGAADTYPPISSYALIGDSHSSGLVSREGSVDWACFRRFDAPSTFARILDWGSGGYCSLAPVGAEPAGRAYTPGTTILESEHEAGDARGRTTDFFAISDMSRAGEAGRVHPPHQLIRIAEGVTGTTDWEFICRPCFEYGIVRPRVTLVGERLGVLAGGPEAMTVASSVPLHAEDGAVRATFRLRDGERAWFALTAHRPEDVRIEALGDAHVDQRLARTRAFWTEWVEQCTYDGPYLDEVIRSAITLKALTNAPTGAIVAAPTTSLPEDVGGVRNWDYRYCWLRDSAFTLYALQLLGFSSEAEAFIEWLTRTTAGRADDLQVLYGIGGERLLPEIQLDHLEGYRGSRPVRIGNAAARQFQLDAYGEVLDTVHVWRKAGGEIVPELWSFLRECVRCIRERWRDPDEGIWEVRGGPRHFVHSKAMCWVGVDRAIKMAQALGESEPLDEWRGLRDEIRGDVLERGFDRELGTFVQAYSSRSLDASAMLLPLMGFIRADDPKMISTVVAIQERLTTDGLVHRYLAEDGLPGEEGAFAICSFWLVDNLALQGRADEARALFERVCSLANDVGLLAEEIDPRTREQLGNFPQAFTHVALINGAFHLPRTMSSR
jgi:GH15 family glucan-1,4-alpha-glucosidase